MKLRIKHLPSDGVKIVLTKTIGLGRSNYGIGTDDRVYRILRSGWWNPRCWNTVSIKKSQEVREELAKFALARDEALR